MVKIPFMKSPRLIPQNTCVLFIFSGAYVFLFPIAGFHASSLEWASDGNALVLGDRDQQHCFCFPTALAPAPPPPPAPAPPTGADDVASPHSAGARIGQDSSGEGDR